MTPREKYERTYQLLRVHRRVLQQGDTSPAQFAQQRQEREQMRSAVGQVAFDAALHSILVRAELDTFEQLRQMRKRYRGSRQSPLRNYAYQLWGGYRRKLPGVTRYHVLSERTLQDMRIAVQYLTERHERRTRS